MEKTRNAIVIRSDQKYKRLLQRYLTVPATFSGRCSEPIGWCTIPPRLQYLVLLSFFFINVVLCCINYQVFEDNLYFTVSTQWARYVADRTGVISTANLPLIWLFATRNNLILYITGWSFDTAMQFHRWVARISTLEAVVHSIAYTMVSLESGWGHYWSEWAQRWWTMGAVATLVMCLLCAFSLYPIRNYHYELFLLLHIGLGVITLLGMWYHVEIFEGAYDWYLWPCLVLWLMDRVARLCRLAYFNFPFRASSIHYDSSSNDIWLSIPVAKNRTLRPGEYYFLYVLHNQASYESHPFTLSSWDQITDANGRVKQRLNFLIRPYDGFTKPLLRIARGDSEVTTPSTMSTQLWALAEGPYGPSHNLKHLDSIVFVVGGSGVAVALAYLTDLCDCVLRNTTTYQTQCFQIIWAMQRQDLFELVYEQEIHSRLDQIAVHCKRITFNLDVFVTRSADDAINANCHELPAILSQHGREVELGKKEISDRLPLLRSQSQTIVSCASSPSTVDIVIYPSSSHTNQNTLRFNHSPESIYNIPQNTTLTLHLGERPNIPVLVAEACHQSSKTGLFSTDTHADIGHSISSDKSTRPRVGVICCGPAASADATRASVVRVLGTTTQANIEFWNESYTW